MLFFLKFGLYKSALNNFSWRTAFSNVEQRENTFRDRRFITR